MRIEISAGGIGYGTSVMEFSSVFDGFLSNTDSVISCFKTIKNETYSLSGGAGNLQTALDNLESRVRTEEALKESAVLAKAKSDSFLSLAQRIDNQVASDVKKNRNEFYSVNSWAKPTTSNEEKKWYEKAWNWLCDRAEEIKEGFCSIGNSLHKLRDSIVEFYHEHENLCKILIGIAAIAIGVIVVVATGGAALALPALLAMAKATLIGGLTSAAISGSIAAVSSLCNGASLESSLNKAFESAINGFCSGFMWGGIFAAGAQIISAFTLPKVPKDVTAARKTGVRQAKKMELDAIKTNTSSYDWSPQQKATFLESNSFPGYEGCHIVDVSRYPRFASDPSNIILLPHTTHFKIVHGGWFANPSNWETIILGMPQFAKQIAQMKALATYSSIVTSDLLPIIPSVVVGTISSTTVQP